MPSSAPPSLSGGRSELIRKAATSSGRAEIKKRKITRYQCLADKKALDRLIARAPSLNRSKKNAKIKWSDEKTQTYIASYFAAMRKLLGECTGL